MLVPVLALFKRRMLWMGLERHREFGRWRKKERRRECVLFQKGSSLL